jgi:hypothetical protein
MPVYNTYITYLYYYNLNIRLYFINNTYDCENFTYNYYYKIKFNKYGNWSLDYVLLKPYNF